MKESKFSLSQRVKSFGYAYNGFRIFIKEEFNARIHLFVTIAVIVTGFVVKLERHEWVAVLFAIGLVLATEIINTAIENLADIISPEKNEKIKRIKDLSAAAVLLSALIACIIGALVFLPKIF